MPIVYNEPLEAVANLQRLPHNHPPRDTPQYMNTRRREPYMPSNQPPHINVVAHPSVPMGDPFNARNVVHESDVWTAGKIRSDPGTHLNLYTPIRAVQAIAEKVWGFVAPTKLMYVGSITYPRGTLRPVGAVVNIDAPDSVSHGELATITGHEGTTIKGVNYA